MRLYTINIGGYDTVNDFVYKDESSRLRLNIRNYKCITESHIDDNFIASRYQKMHPPFPLEEGAITVYHDGAFKYIGKDFKRWAEENLGDSDIAFAPSFSCGDCYQEAEYCLSKGKGDPYILDKQVEAYRKEGVKEGGNLAQGGIFIFRDSLQVRQFLKEWWDEFIQYPSRDQIALHKLRQQTKLKVGWINPHSVVAGHPFNGEVECEFEYIHRNPNINIFYSNPWGYQKNLGKAYNDFCETVPNDDDWIVLQDGDILYLHDYWGDIIRDTIIRNPDVHLFGCYTNRLGLSWQLYKGKVSYNANIRHHQKIANHLARFYWGKVDIIDKPIAGLFMCFQKKHWIERPFHEGLYIKEKNALVDWDFTSSFLERGLTVGLMKGLYVFHKYRLDKPIKDIEHLL